MTEHHCSVFALEYCCTYKDNAKRWKIPSVKKLEHYRTQTRTRQSWASTQHWHQLQSLRLPGRNLCFALSFFSWLLPPRHYSKPDFELSRIFLVAKVVFISHWKSTGSFGEQLRDKKMLGKQRKWFSTGWVFLAFSAFWSHVEVCHPQKPYPPPTVI